MSQHKLGFATAHSALLGSQKTVSIRKLEPLLLSLYHLVLCAWHFVLEFFVAHLELFLNQIV